MGALALGLALVVVATIGIAAAGRAFQRRLRRMRDDHSLRPTLWNRRDGVTFIEGSAMELPFSDSSVDVLLNVEASNDYPDRTRFFAEVRRVLKPDGVFLYTDTEKARNEGRMARDLTEAGFCFELRDITGNVVEACRADSPRRRAVIASRAPLPARLFLRKELANYAAIEGSDKFRHFETGQRRYHLTAARPA